MMVAALTSEFTVDTGYDVSLLSEEFATTGLGLDLSLLSMDPYATYVGGEISIWTAVLPYQLFPEDPKLPNKFGIVPNSYNPDNINLLGTDILTPQGVYQMDTPSEKLRAGEIVPEPSTIILLFAGLLGATYYHRWISGN